MSGLALSVGIWSKALMPQDLWQFKVLNKKVSKNVGSRSGKLVFNSVLNFRRGTHFWLCLPETQVNTDLNAFLFARYLGHSSLTICSCLHVTVQVSPAPGQYWRQALAAPPLPDGGGASRGRRPPARRAARMSRWVRRSGLLHCTVVRRVCSIGAVATAAPPR